MQNIIPYHLFESSKTSSLIDSIIDGYEELKYIGTESGTVIGKYGDIKIRVINRDLLKLQMPEWQAYIGSHHWGKKTDYIPEDEIWIAHGLDKDRARKLLNHEIIEREMMRALEDEKSMDPQTAWEIAHPLVKQMGF